MNCPTIRTTGLSFVFLLASVFPGAYAAEPIDSTTGFEQAKPGELMSIETAAGVFSAEPGHARIDAAHARGGRQCLHLVGGTERTVELIPRFADAEPAFLTFHAERWTRRNPFRFRVLAFQNDKWSEIYNGDADIKIGGFLTAVSVPLTGRPERFRFVCTSPEKSGLLIDDLAIVPATSQRILGASVENHVVPILADAERVPLLHLRVRTTGTLNPMAVRAVEVLLEPTENLRVIHGLGDQAELMLDAISESTKKRRLALTGRQILSHGENEILISGDAAKTVDLDETFSLTCTRIEFSDGTSIVPEHEQPPKHRAGVAVRTAGQDGVHTSRIPGLATTNEGTLIAVFDLRHRSGGDLPGDIDVGMARSTDGGLTWQPTRTILDMGNDPEFRYDGAGDPSILVDRKTGTIWVAAVWSHGNRGWFGSGPGLTPDQTGQFLLVRSDDDGLTWSQPINITRQIKKPEWAFLLQGPGKGITLADGTLVFPAQFQDSPENGRLPYSTIVCSEDHGKTWTIGTGAFPATTEAQVVELEAGELMLNARYNRQSARVVMTTGNRGRTWSEHPTSRKSLIEPGTCMASLINIDRERDRPNRDRLLFSNPANLRERARITIKASEDGGTTWSRGVLLDADRSAGYSCLSMIDDQTVGILYEGSRAQMTFQRVKLADLFPKN